MTMYDYDFDDETESAVQAGDRQDFLKEVDQAYPHLRHGGSGHRGHTTGMKGVRPEKPYPVDQPQDAGGRWENGDPVIDRWGNDLSKSDLGSGGILYRGQV